MSAYILRHVIKADTVHFQVEKRLKEMARRAREFAKTLERDDEDHKGNDLLRNRKLP
jgi:hypothetical protein